MTDFPITSDNRIKGVFEKQWIHFLSIFVFTIIFYLLTRIDGVVSGTDVFGFSAEQLYWIAFFTPIIHQIIVWFCWRIQLYYNSLNKMFGKFGFWIYAIIFSIFFVNRLISIILLGIVNQDTLIEYKEFFWILFIILVFPVVYLGYSVKQYFGVVRAFGIDHFDPEYHKLPIVKKGIFKYTNNGMYIFGLLVLYLPGLYYASLGALLIALFNHIFIWIHYYTVEKPDMEKIYRN
jgi:hypothetical protein